MLTEIIFLIAFLQQCFSKLLFYTLLSYYHTHKPSYRPPLIVLSIEDNDLDQSIVLANLM